MIWGSKWKAPSFTAGDYTATPNSAAPDANEIFETGGGFPAGTGGLLTLTVGAPATATVTVTIWVYDDTLQLWVPWVTGLVVTFGTMQTKDMPALAKVYIQITAVANAPTSFSVGWMSR